MRFWNRMMLFVVFFVAATAHAASDTYLGNARSLTWTIDALYLWSDALCATTPITVFDNSANPVSSDFLSSPTLATTSINFSGTFNCVGIKMSSVLMTVSGFTSGPCTAGTPVQLNIYSPSTCSGCTSQNVDGSAGPSPSTSAQSIIMYFSTASTNGNPSQGFMKPTSQGDNTNGTALASSFVVSSSRVGTFVTKNLQYMGFYGSSPSECDIISGAAGTPNPAFTFQ